MDVTTFLGHFHPIAVHLPIGFIVLALFFQFLSLKPRYESLYGGIRVILLLTSISSSVACIFGWLLTLGGEYDLNLLSTHKWGGIIFAVLCLFLWLAYPRVSRKTNFYTLLGANLALMFIGHQGGSLTHGEDYLSIQKLLEKPQEKPDNLEKVSLYTHVVKEIIKENCQQCHREGKKKGEYLTSSFSGLIKGGKNGPAVVAGDPSKSELFRRITLDPSHKEFMPTEGKPPLKENEIKLIELWIKKGAPESGIISTMQLKKEEEDLVATYTGFKQVNGANSLAQKMHISGIVSTDAIDKLREEGFGIRVMLQNPSVLDISTLGLQKMNKSEVLRKLDMLKPVATNVLWLNLKELDLRNEDLSILKSFTHLEKLHLSQNPISEKVAENIQHLAFLEALNLYGTQISTSELQLLAKNNHLNNLYLGESSIHVKDTVGLNTKVKIVL